MFWNEPLGKLSSVLREDAILARKGLRFLERELTSEWKKPFSRPRWSRDLRKTRAQYPCCCAFRWVLHGSGALTTYGQGNQWCLRCAYVCGVGRATFEAHVNWSSSLQPAWQAFRRLKPRCHPHVYTIRAKLVVAPEPKPFCTSVVISSAFCLVFEGAIW